MADKQGSARVTLREIDLSQVRDPEQLPQGVPAAVVGPAKRGPAFVPRTFADMQQFGEVFGSMLEISKESNANRFGPLALNEWMRSAQAGTFLRVLGIGDADGRITDATNKVTGAGFVVGNKVSHDSSSNNLQDNPSAQIEDGREDGARLAARTHLLGCFMKDVSGSTFLQDAGLTTAATAAATTTITISDEVTSGGTITLIDSDGKEVTYTSAATADLPNNKFVNGADGADANAKALLAAASLTAAINNSAGHGSTITAVDNLDGTIDLTQDIQGLAGNTKVTETAANLTVNNFSGGTGALPAKIIRGLLMSPQGILPSLSVTSANYGAIPSSHDDITKDVATDNETLAFFGTDAADLFGYEIGAVSANDQSFKLILNGFDSSTEPKVLTCSFDPESVNYFAKVLNTDPEKIEDRGHYLHMHWDIDKSKAIPSNSGTTLSDGTTPSSLNESAFCMHTSLGRTVSNEDIPDLESYDTRFRTAASPWFVSQDFGGTTYNLFKLHALDDGAAGNDRFRILISNVRAGLNQNDYGTFDLSLEAFDSDPVNGEALITWNRLSLDPDSKNFIGRVIGDRHVYFDFDRAANKQRLVEEGDYEVRNSYVRVELHDDVAGGLVPANTLVAGFSNYTTLNTTASDVLVESGDDNSGNNKLLPLSTLDGVAALPMPLVKSILLSNSANSSLPWGVKFSKYEKTSEINDIRFNSSMKSWTMFMPDLGGSNASAGVVNTSKEESFSLERIAVSDASSIDWDTSTYIRSGADADLGGKQFIVLNDAASVGRNVKYLKFRCLMQGGFDGLNIFNKDKAALNTFAAHREANDETGSTIFTGPTIVAYKKAIDVLADKSATEFQLLAIPGLREPLVTDYAITACESRFDAMFVMDIEETDGTRAVINDLLTKVNVTETKSHFEARGLDTSFAAAYFPDVLVRRPSTGSALQVPPSVAMLGVMSQNDRIADPWFAPAGLNRGRVGNATKSKVQMNRDVLDDLYDADINPIYEPAGRAGQVYAFGQKTLLQDASALDRINVRRLLISIRRQVKAIAQTFLFEPNRESTLIKFSSLVEPLMSDIQARQGVERYKVQIDTSTTTDNDVLNNTIRGKIYLQPTKSVEFISLDFVVTNSID